VLKAFRLPKDSEQERLHRGKRIQRAYQKATITPQLVCRHSIQLLEDSKTLILRGTSIAISDAGVAAFLADAALAGGLLNIQVNLESMTDRTFVKKMDLLMKGLSRKRSRLMRAITNLLVGMKQG
jgi:formiminotetrahydrofolate cyclodeaminase